MKKLLIILIVSGLMGLGCAPKQKMAIPPRPTLENSIVYDNGTMVLPLGDQGALNLYIIQLGEFLND